MSKDQKDAPILLVKTPLSQEDIELLGKETNQAKLERLAHEVIRKTYPEYICSLSLIPNPNPSEEIPYGDTLVRLFLDFMSGVIRHLFQNKTLFQEKKAAILIHASFLTFSKSFEERMPKENSKRLLQNILAANSVEHIPNKIHLLDLEDTKLHYAYMLDTFYRYYEVYCYLFVTEKHLSLVTLPGFEIELPKQMKIGENGVFFVDNLREVSQIQEYLPPTEYQPTEEEIQEIMKGNSVHNISPAQREQIIKRHLEKQRKSKIDQIMDRELRKITEKMNQKIQEQDQGFLDKFNPKNKKT